MFFFRYCALGVAVLSVFFLNACGDTTLHDTWKGTKGLYYEYLNRPASVDYDDKGDLEDSVTLLARNMRRVDQELTRFERYMMNQDRAPNQESVDALFDRFRWVGGVAAVSAEGEVLAQQPANIKQLDYSTLLDIETREFRSLRGDVQMTPFGPEVLLGVPVYDSSELKGLFIAHFDIRLLLDGVPDPGNFVITSPKGVLWPGVFGGTPLDGQDWSEILKTRTSGRVGDGNGTFYWQCRYLGGLPLIFGAPAQDHGFVTNPAQLETLRELGISVPVPVAEQPIGEDAVLETVADDSGSTASLLEDMPAPAEQDEDDFEIE